MLQPEKYSSQLTSRGQRVCTMRESSKVEERKVGDYHVNEYTNISGRGQEWEADDIQSKSGRELGYLELEGQGDIPAVAVFMISLTTVRDKWRTDATA